MKKWTTIRLTVNICQNTRSDDLHVAAALDEAIDAFLAELDQRERHAITLTWEME